MGGTKQRSQSCALSCLHRHNTKKISDCPTEVFEFPPSAEANGTWVSFSMCSVNSSRQALHRKNKFRVPTLPVCVGARAACAEDSFPKHHRRRISSGSKGHNAFVFQWNIDKKTCVLLSVNRCRTNTPTTYTNQINTNRIQEFHLFVCSKIHTLFF